MRRAPTAFRLQHVTPERDLAEDAADGAWLVAAARVRQCLDRIARGVEAAVATGAGYGMRRDRLGKRILVPPALGDDRLSVRPHELVQHRAEPETRRGLGDDPGTPARDRAAALANCASGLHQGVFTSRLSAGLITSSTRP